MSEFSNTSAGRIDILNRYMIGIIEGINGAKLVNDLGLKADNFIPSDVLSSFDLLFEAKTNLSEMKTASNKLFNILYETLKAYPAISPSENSFIHYLVQDNALVAKKLKDLSPHIKNINQLVDEERLQKLKTDFTELEKFTWHYTVKENILFPILEANWKEHDCLKLMWSFHDDIRQNFKKIITLLSSEHFELKEFNTLAGLLFFNISTIIFREEKILFPIMMETLDAPLMDRMLVELSEMKLPFVKITPLSKTPAEASPLAQNLIKLPTGEFTVEQAELIFNHLPVDITFVDEKDTVRYFSTPKDRIFPRTASIIGRKVQNCHPPESMDTVIRIVESFRKGEKDQASFWLHLGPKFVLIQYFAVRDKEKKYRGVLEVSQEISEIQEIKGDRKLLDW
jgi:DUF438 domain-containing protein